eukprot:scaffold6430_cov133-Isochrysis_galbana.AAC.1
MAWEDWGDGYPLRGMTGYFRRIGYGNETGLHHSSTRVALAHQAAEAPAYFRILLCGLVLFMAAAAGHACWRRARPSWRGGARAIRLRSSAESSSLPENSSQAEKSILAKNSSPAGAAGRANHARDGEEGDGAGGSRGGSRGMGCTGECANMAGGSKGADGRGVASCAFPRSTSLPWKRLSLLRPGLQQNGLPNDRTTSPGGWAPARRLWNSEASALAPSCPSLPSTSRLSLTCCPSLNRAIASRIEALAAPHALSDRVSLASAASALSLC